MNQKSNAVSASVKASDIPKGDNSPKKESNAAESASIKVENFEIET
jgi:hypothetical protein